MGLLDAVKRAFNIGGCRLTINSNKSFYPQGSLVEGEVRLEGGGLDQRCNLMCIELEEFWKETRGSGEDRKKVTIFRTRGRKVLGQDISILPGDSSTYEFSLKLPINSRLSTSTTGWRLKVSLDIPSLINPCGISSSGFSFKVNLDIPNLIGPCSILNLKVTGAEEFKAVSTACSEIFQLREKDKSWRWDVSQSTSFRMLPFEEMRREFDYIDFSLKQVEDTGGVCGRIIFNLQEKYFMDYLKAMLFMDRVEKPLALSGEQLFCADGTVNRIAIRNVIEPLIREIVESRNQYEKNMQPEHAGKNINSRAPAKSAIPKKKPQKEFDPRKLDDYCNR